MRYTTLSLSLLLMALTGCQHDHHDHNGHNGHDDHHHHDDVALLITGYSDHFEVFAEADPLVAGHTTTFHIHITRLDNFKPLEKGSVTLYLTHQDETISQTTERTVRPGIFRIDLQAEKTGMTQITFDVEHDGKTHTIDGGSFRVYDDAHRALHGAEDLLPDHPTAITFTKEQSWTVGFATTPVVRQSIGQIIKTVGEILPSPTDEITISAQTHGIIQLAHAGLYAGMYIEEGEALLSITGEGLAERNATQRYREALSDFNKAQADYERLSGLSEAGIISQRELLEAENIYEKARAHYHNLSQNFSESGQLIVSPASGYISQMLVKQGQYVEAGQPVAVIARNSEMVVKALVQQRYASALPGLYDAHLGDETIRTLAELEGSIIVWSRNTHPQTHLLEVHLAINNQPGWVSGKIVDVYLKSRSSKTHIVVPNDALVEEQGNYFVFVQLHPESFEKREVFTGATDGIQTEIVNGLEENERVVSRGALMVKMAGASGELDPHAGHVH